MDQIAPFRRLDYEFKKILEFQFIAFRFGRIAREHYQKLERYTMIQIMYYFMNVTVTRHMCGAAILCQESTQKK